MYKKSVQGWLKHLDFMILDVVCLWISFTLAFNMRHGSLDVLANSLYRDMMWSLALMDIVVIFFFSFPLICTGVSIVHFRFDIPSISYLPYCTPPRQNRGLLSYLFFLIYFLYFSPTTDNL